MTTQPHCPICRRDGVHIADNNALNRDAIRVECPRCGRFSIDRLLAGALPHDLGSELFRLAYATRSASEASTEVFVDTAETAKAMADTAPRWRTADEGVGRLLVVMSRGLRRFNAQLEPRQVDYTLLPAEDESAFPDLLGMAGQMGYYDPGTRRITPEGWRRIEALRAVQSSARQAFVAMHFAPDLNAAWVDGFKPGIEASGFFSALRIDRKEFNNKIDDEIVAEIRRSGLLVADFTNQRQSVYFEAGFAMGLGVPVIYSCRDTDIDHVHFDARQYNHIVWSSPSDLATKLDQRIRATVLPFVHPSA